VESACLPRKIDSGYVESEHCVTLNISCMKQNLGSAKEIYNAQDHLNYDHIGIAKAIYDC
jgi:hypothetical protein